MDLEDAEMFEVNGVRVAVLGRRQGVPDELIVNEIRRRLKNRFGVTITRYEDRPGSANLGEPIEALVDFWKD